MPTIDDYNRQMEDYIFKGTTARKDCCCTAAHGHADLWKQLSELERQHRELWASEPHLYIVSENCSDNIYRLNPEEFDGAKVVFGPPLSKLPTELLLLFYNRKWQLLSDDPQIRAEQLEKFWPKEFGYKPLTERKCL